MGKYPGQLFLQLNQLSGTISDASNAWVGMQTLCVCWCAVRLCRGHALTRHAPVTTGT
jgi:hypothetical protein